MRLFGDYEKRNVLFSFSRWSAVLWLRCHGGEPRNPICYSGVALLRPLVQSGGGEDWANIGYGTLTSYAIARLIFWCWGYCVSRLGKWSNLPGEGSPGIPCSTGPRSRSVICFSGELSPVNFIAGHGSAIRFGVSRSGCAWIQQSQLSYGAATTAAACGMEDSLTQSLGCW